MPRSFIALLTPKLVECDRGFHEDVEEMCEGDYAGHHPSVLADVASFRDLGHARSDVAIRDDDSVKFINSKSPHLCFEAVHANLWRFEGWYQWIRVAEQLA